MTTPSHPDDRVYDDDAYQPRTSISTDANSEDLLLAKLGYRQEFVREFTNFSTFSFAASIMGVVASITSTFNTPILAGAAAPVWCWLIGSCFCMTIGASVAEIVSAYPTSGGLYYASSKVFPIKAVPTISFIVGWLNTLGQIAGFASTDFALAQMINACIVIGTDGNTALTNTQLILVYFGLVIIHGALNCLATKTLARITNVYVIINFATSVAVIAAIFAGQKNKNTASYVFTHLEDNTGWNSQSISFLLGILSVSWTMTDYDASAHICEEVRRASIAAPVAIFQAVIYTGIVGFFVNLALIYGAVQPLINYPGPSGLAVAQILFDAVGKQGAVAIVAFIAVVAFFTGATALQANARTVFALARDNGIPGASLWSRMNKRQRIPIWGVWFVVAISILMGCLAFASLTAVIAIFSLATIGMDVSYMIPIFGKFYYCHIRKEIAFPPGPFTMGPTLGPIVNGICICWISFVTIVLCLPQVQPVNAGNMNYACLMAGGVILLSLIWYYLDAHKRYHGPQANITKQTVDQLAAEVETKPKSLSDSEGASSGEKRE